MSLRTVCWLQASMRAYLAAVYSRRLFGMSAPEH